MKFSSAVAVRESDSQSLGDSSCLHLPGRHVSLRTEIFGHMLTLLSHSILGCIYCSSIISFFVASKACVESQQ